MARINHMVDQFRSRLQPGQLYGLSFGGGTVSRVFRCFAILRKPKPLACFVEIDTRTRGLTGQELTLSNDDCALYFFSRLDGDFREIPNPTIDARVSELKRFLRELEREATKLRKRQTRLMQEAIGALEGCGDPAEIGDAVASWVRDDSSHISTRQLVELFRQSEKPQYDAWETP
jgi:hypothetical protein